MSAEMPSTAKESDRRHKCSICTKSFKRSDHLRAHQYVHTKNRPRPFPCIECKYKAPTQTELNKHTERHHQKWSPEKCPHCDKYFARPSLCQDHIKRMHSTVRVKSHSCIFCGNNFLHKSALTRHTCAHIEERWFSCELCGETFYTCTEKYSHIRRHHTKERAHCCKVCKKGFATQQEVLRHTEVNHTIRQNSHSCEKCGKSITSKMRLVAHQSRVHASAERRSRFKCELCGKGFIVRHELQGHLRTHENAINRPYSTCLICNIKRRFFSQEALEVHTYVHTEERPFICRTCGSERPRKVDLTIHGFVHSNEYSFPCGLCPSKFKREYHLKGHLRRMHSIAR